MVAPTSRIVRREAELARGRRRRSSAFVGWGRSMKLPIHSSKTVRPRHGGAGERWRTPHPPSRGDPVHRGRSRDYMFAVESGRLAVHKLTETGARIQLRFMTVGDVGGLTSMTTNKPRSATLIALGATQLVTVPRLDFQRCLGSRPDLAESVIRYLAAKVGHRLSLSFAPVLRIIDDTRAGRIAAAVPLRGRCQPGDDASCGSEGVFIGKATDELASTRALSIAGTL